MLNNLQQPVKLNLGCGGYKSQGYVNVDLYNPARDLTCDLTKFPYPFKDCSADEIVMSHVIEHLSWRLTEKVLEEVYRILTPGGLFKIGYPDFLECARNFVENKQGLRDWWKQTIYGMQIDDGQYHKAPIITDELVDMMRAIGLKTTEITSEAGREYNKNITAIKVEPLNWF